MLEFIQIAMMLPATVYGVVNPETGNAEMMCGETIPVACDSKATTASGQPFNPAALTVALPMPRNRIMRPVRVCLRNVETGMEVWVTVNDKTAPRWQGVRGFDITPAVFKALTGQEAQVWSGIPELGDCE